MQTYEELQTRIKARPRKWLVTGVAGFIGSHLAQNLLKLGQEVVGLDNFSTGTRANLEHVRAAVGGAWQNFRFIEGDIRSLEACREACRSVELVLHEAALGSVPRSIDKPVPTHESNINGFLNMLIAARDAGVSRLVYASSSAVYGDDDTMPKVEPRIGKPMSPYGLSKQVNEQYASVFATCYGFETVGMRYFNVFGPRQDPDGPIASVIPAWIGALLRNETAYINGDGTHLARLLPCGQRGAGKPPRRHHRECGGSEPGLQRRARRADHAHRAVRAHPHAAHPAHAAPAHGTRGAPRAPPG